MNLQTPVLTTVFWGEVGYVICRYEWCINMKVEFTRRLCLMLHEGCIYIVYNDTFGDSIICMGESFQDYFWIQDFEDDFPQKVILKMLN